MTFHALSSFSSAQKRSHDIAIIQIGGGLKVTLQKHFYFIPEKVLDIHFYPDTEFFGIYVY